MYWPSLTSNPGETWGKSPDLTQYFLKSQPALPTGQLLPVLNSINPHNHLVTGVDSSPI